MDDPGLGSDQNRQALSPVFVSYSTTDRNQALSICKAIEGRGTPCWISSRDVAPGANYQEAIVHSIRDARAMVLVFSEAANSSDEIKKELSLASRYHVPVIALRIEDVEPSDAFAYELSTRQWIDAFEGWDRSIDALVGRIGQLSGAEPIATTTAASVPRRASFPARSPMAIAIVAGLLLVAIAAGAWWYFRPAVSAQHAMSVRLAGFKVLSADLPATFRDTVDAEIAAAFNADGVVGVSTAPVPTAAPAPAYALGGTIRRDGPTIRVITRLSNERSGETLWTDNFNYAGSEVSKVPRHIAVDAGNVVRCGLFGASTYYKPLPDPVLRDYMQFCQGHWDTNLQEGRKALIPAQRVVAAVPDFSWGWAAVAGAYWKVAMTADIPALDAAARASGREAADRAVAIDSRNSEALYIKAVLLDRTDWIGREALFKRAVAARRLDCGCEHHQYGSLLIDVGRIAEGVDQLRQANDMLALYVYTPLTLANALTVAGRLDEAKKYYDAAIELAPDAEFAKHLASFKAMQTSDTELWRDPALTVSPELRAAMLAGFRAVASQDMTAKSQAVEVLLALPEKQQNAAVARLLGSLGADHQAFQIAARLATAPGRTGPSLFWYPSMRGTLADPGFPTVAKQLGLMSYWRSTRVRPDACGQASAPAFCRMI